MRGGKHPAPSTRHSPIRETRPEGPAQTPQGTSVTSEERPNPPPDPGSALSCCDHRFLICQTQGNSSPGLAQRVRGQCSAGKCSFSIHLHPWPPTHLSPTEPPPVPEEPKVLPWHRLIFSRNVCLLTLTLGYPAIAAPGARAETPRESAVFSGFHTHVTALPTRLPRATLFLVSPWRLGSTGGQGGSSVP